MGTRNAARSGGATWSDLVRALIGPLASLKLTVALLGISVLVVWLVTLDQAKMDIWEVKQKHFTNILVFVPFQTLFPPGWFPGLQDIAGGFYVPSGMTLILALLVNLTAAHLLRFRLQARGARLWAGIAVGILTGIVTWLVIFSSSDPGGIQGQPPISYEAMWVGLQILGLGLVIASIAGAYLVGKDRFIERTLLVVFALVMGMLLVYTVVVGRDAFIGDSGMRILWQLTQSTVAASIGLVACHLLFRRKAGIVLLHLGIAGLMLNEIYVTTTNVEQRMLLFENQTAAHAVDVRSTELVVIDRSDPEKDRITVVPGSRLTPGARISDEQLPFDVEVLEYYPNSTIVRAEPGQPNPADQGIGTQWVARPARPTAGADASQTVNEAAAYIRLIDRQSDQPLGTWLVSQWIYDRGVMDRVEVGGTTYLIGLRLKHIYKPYTVTLTDVQKRDYIGTAIPQWFSSDIVIHDDQHDLETAQKVWMNNPLRYGDETFYQSGYNRLPDGREYTVLQVVKNRGWMIPYVCCMFVVVGMFAQFGTTLLGFLKKSNDTARQRLQEAWQPGVVGAKRSEGHASFWYRWGPTLVLVGLMAVYAGSKLGRAMRPSVERGQFQLQLLGQIPLTFGGRVQPLDSLARNTARHLSNREYVVDGNGVKQHPLRWFADLVFESPGHLDYQIIRIEDMNVQNALGLPRRKGFKYTLGEIQAAYPKIVEILPDPNEVPEAEWTVLEKRVLDVYQKFDQLRKIQMAISPIENRVGANEPLMRLQMADMIARADGLPYLVPTDNVDEPWVALTTALNRRWLYELAQRYGETNPEKLATRLVRDEMIKEQIIQTLVSDPELLTMFKQMTGLDDPQAIRRRMLESWDQFPDSLRQELEPVAAAQVDLMLANRPSGPDDPFAQAIRRILGPGQDQIAPFENDKVDLLASLAPAYNNSDPTAFNQALTTYLDQLQREAANGKGPIGWKPVAHRTELVYNEFAPFHMAMVIYMCAFLVSVLAWAGWRIPLNRAAFSLIALALLIHVGGIVARVIISGRPPVTNLYSSFVFVSAGAVAMLMVVELISRLGIGNVMAGLAGTASLLWAWTLSIDSGDTFTVLRAVLDTQFWLSTHVICISIGYIATLAAGLLGVAFIIGGMMTSAFDAATRKMLCGLIYGITCFAIFFSFFGTVLGGLWADDSWGRFWGWDPKENGALMIVLWNAVVLHARWGGLVRQRGLASLAALGNIVTLWSWEGVNRLGVGLHAYGGVTASESGASFLMNPDFWLQLFVLANLVVCLAAILPESYWKSYRRLAPAEGKNT